MSWKYLLLSSMSVSHRQLGLKAWSSQVEMGDRNWVILDNDTRRKLLKITKGEGLEWEKV